MQIQSALRDLLEASKELTGIDDDLSVLQETALFLYLLFSPAPEMCRSHGEAIKKQFGPYPASVAANVASIVKRIVSLQFPTSSVDEYNKVTESMAQEFGHNMSFSFSHNFTDEASLHDTFDEQVLFEDSVGADEDNNTELITKGLMQGMKKTSSFSRKEHVPKVRGENNTVASKYGKLWLERACQLCRIQGLSWQQLYSKLFDLLISEKEGPVMETEVYTLLHS